MLGTHHLIKCLQHHQGGAPLVRLHSRRVRCGYELQFAVLFQAFIQFCQFSIDEYQDNILWIFRLMFLGDGEVRRTRLVVFYFSIDRNLKHPYLLIYDQSLTFTTPAPGISMASG